MNTPHTMRERVRIEPRLTWRPITKMRYRQHTRHYGEVRSGTRWFLFGILPVLTVWDHAR